MPPEVVKPKYFTLGCKSVVKFKSLLMYCTHMESGSLDNVAKCEKSKRAMLTIVLYQTNIRRPKSIRNRFFLRRNLVILETRGLRTIFLNILELKKLLDLNNLKIDAQDNTVLHQCNKCTY